MPTSPLFNLSVPGGPLRIGLLSTYPPQLCGLATFAAALERELRAAGDVVDVVRIDDAAGGEPFLAPIVAQLVPGRTSSLRQTVAVLSRCDVAIVQHEYGIYGGPDGDEVLELLRRLTVPSIVVLHTVLAEPSANQRRVLGEVVALADRVVVMTEAARQRLGAAHDVDPSKVMTIPHGAAVPVLHACPELDPVLPAPKLRLLTWGLLGPGKGIEHVISALALLDHRGALHYTIAGVTHPKVLAAQGDRYRRSLIALTERHGLGDVVSFDATYRDVSRLTALVASASAVVLPYDSREQVTSGVLADAIAAGRPVIATAFPHAVELLAGGAGIVVPHGEPAALADAIRSLLDRPGRLAAMAAAAGRLAPSLSWAAVAGRYRHLAAELATAGARRSNPTTVAM
jgi:polysaccharide biosynthesis protein PslF